MVLHGDRARWLYGGDGSCIRSDPFPARPLRLVLLGAPGVGKGTQAAYISDTYKACPLSTGDVFREAKCGSARALSAAMQDAMERMSQGFLVSDETVVELVRERGHCLTCGYGFILDGFPRTVSQAVALDSLLEERDRSLHAVLNYTLPEEVVVRRLSGRRTCSECKSTYHLEFGPPASPGICDKCGGDLFQRVDDQPEAIRVRLQAYEKSTAPLAEHYASEGILENIPAEGDPRDVFARSRGFLDRLVAVAC